MRLLAPCPRLWLLLAVVSRALRCSAHCAALTLPRDTRAIARRPLGDAIGCGEFVCLDDAPQGSVYLGGYGDAVTGCYGSPGADVAGTCAGTPACGTEVCVLDDGAKGVLPTGCDVKVVAADDADCDDGDVCSKDFCVSSGADKGSCDASARPCSSRRTRLLLHAADVIASLRVSRAPVPCLTTGCMKPFSAKHLAASQSRARCWQTKPPTCQAALSPLTPRSPCAAAIDTLPADADGSEDVCTPCSVDGDCAAAAEPCEAGVCRADGDYKGACNFSSALLVLLRPLCLHSTLQWCADDIKHRTSFCCSSVGSSGTLLATPAQLGSAKAVPTLMHRCRSVAWTAGTP